MATDNRALVAISALTAAAAAVNSFTALFSMLPPFFLDVTSSALLLLLVGAWLVKSRTASQQPDGSGALLDGAGRPITRARTASPGYGAVIPAVLVLGGLAVWNAVPAARVISDRHWTMCGTIATRLSAPCYLLLDQRHRPIRADCVRPQDDSGYLRVVQQRWWQYRPSHATVQSGGQAEFELTPAFFDPACGAFMELS